MSSLLSKYHSPEADAIQTDLGSVLIILYVESLTKVAIASYDKIRRGAQLGKPLTASDFVESTALVNHYYFYGVDEDFGPFFLKF